MFVIELKKIRKSQKYGIPLWTISKYFRYSMRKTNLFWLLNLPQITSNILRLKTIFVASSTAETLTTIKRFPLLRLLILMSLGILRKNVYQTCILKHLCVVKTFPGILSYRIISKEFSSIFDFANALPRNCNKNPFHAPLTSSLLPSQLFASSLPTPLERGPSQRQRLQMKSWSMSYWRCVCFLMKISIRLFESLCWSMPSVFLPCATPNDVPTRHSSTAKKKNLFIAQLLISDIVEASPYLICFSENADSGFKFCLFSLGLRLVADRRDFFVLPSRSWHGMKNV